MIAPLTGIAHPMKRGYAQTRWGQVHYMDEGGGDALVLLGPAGRSARVHTALIPLLASRYRVLAPDTLGFGNSDPLPAGATIEMLAESMVDLLDDVGASRAHVYGLHTGNKIATAIAARWPERVRKLVLCGQTHSLIPDQARRNQVIRDLVHGYFAGRDVDDESRRALNAWAAAYRNVTDLWWAEALFAAGDMASAIDNAKSLVLDEIQSLGSTVAIYEANFAYDLGEGYRGIRSPTLIIEVVTPAEDRGIGRQGHDLLQIISGATLVTLSEPVDGVVTLEDRASDLARILTEFLD